MFVREDYDDVVIPFAQALSKHDLKIVFFGLSRPLPPLKPDVRQLEEAISLGLRECSYGLMLLTPNFFAWDWFPDQLNQFTFHIDKTDRLISVWHNVTRETVQRYSVPSAQFTSTLTQHGFEQAAKEIHKQVNKCEPDLSEAIKRAGINERILGVVACPNCETRPRLYLACITTPPQGSSGMLLCKRCSRAYLIINGVPQLQTGCEVSPNVPEPPLY
jgi:uncharacterized protein YbaR (Trm112 family)